MSRKCKICGAEHVLCTRELLTRITKLETRLRDSENGEAWETLQEDYDRAKATIAAALEVPKNWADAVRIYKEMERILRRSYPDAIL